MSNLTIITYHYVRPIKNSIFPNVKGLEIEKFKKQLNFLQKNYNIICLQNLIEYHKENKNIPSKSCLLTFDDGFKDHYIYVYPELARRGIAGVFFPPARAIIEKKITDTHKIHFVLAKNKNYTKLIKEIKFFLANKKNYKIDSFLNYWNKFAKPNAFDVKEVIFIKRMLQKALPKDIRKKLINFLFNKYVTKNQKKFASDLYFSFDEIYEMQKGGMDFGIHSYEHDWLDELSYRDQERDINKSIKFLNKIYKGKNVPRTICYPYGAYNKNTLNILKSKKFIFGFTTKKGKASLKKNNFLTLSRFDTNDILF